MRSAAPTVGPDDTYYVGARTRITSTEGAIGPGAAVRPNDIAICTILAKLSAPVVQQLADNGGIIRCLWGEQATESSVHAVAHIGVRSGRQSIRRKEISCRGGTCRVRGRTGATSIGRFDKGYVIVLLGQTSKVAPCCHSLAISANIDHTKATKRREI